MRNLQSWSAQILGGNLWNSLVILESMRMDELSNNLIHTFVYNFYLVFLESMKMDELSNKVICTVVFKICG